MIKLDLKKTILFLSALIAGSTVFAQTPDSIQAKNYVQPFSRRAFRTWSIGINEGITSPYTAVAGKQDFKDPGTQVGYGGYIKDQLSHVLGIEADYFGGKLTGSGTPTGTTSPYSSFSTQINWSAALQFNITLANINWRHNQGSVQPYLTFGGGYMGFTPTVDDLNGNSTPVASPDASFKEVFIPVGLGLKFDIARGVNLDLGYQINFVNSDFVDGYSTGPTNDKFSYAHLGLEFALGKRSKQQMATHNPVSSMRYEYLSKAQALQAELDEEKVKNAQLRADLNTTNANLSATNASLAKLTQDSDGDGVPDLFDKCPNTPAGTKVDGSVCPLPVAKPAEKIYITEEDKKVVKDAIANLEFDLGKATIRDHSLPSLDKVADLLVSKNFSLKLAGHTDNSGSADLNMRLSKDRAESIKTYLVSKGANPSRIEATGYGMTQPIATNKTSAGRQQNRRVEFTIY